MATLQAVEVTGPPPCARRASTRVQRPPADGGAASRERYPPRLGGRTAWRARSRRAGAWVKDRSTWNVSLVTSPRQARAQSASTVSGANPPPAAASISGKNDAPRADRCFRIRRSRSPSGAGPDDAGNSRGSASARNRATRPSRAPTASSPTQSTSPPAARASRSPGR